MGSDDGFKVNQPIIFFGFYIHSISVQKIPKSPKVPRQDIDSGEANIVNRFSFSFLIDRILGKG